MTSSVTIPRPAADEVEPYYHGYIADVPDERIASHLAAQIDQAERLLGRLDDRAALARYAPGKWSMKEVLGHVTDAERIFGYRMLRIARGDATPLPGFDENAYVPEGRFDTRELRHLLAEFRAVRGATLALVEGLAPEVWARRGIANGHAISARALAYVIVGHAAHHFAVLRDRYGLRAS